MFNKYGFQINGPYAPDDTSNITISPTPITIQKKADSSGWESQLDKANNRVEVQTRNIEFIASEIARLQKDTGFQLEFTWSHPFRLDAPKSTKDKRIDELKGLYNQALAQQEENVFWVKLYSGAASIISLSGAISNLDGDATVMTDDEILALYDMPENASPELINRAKQAIASMRTESGASAQISPDLEEEFDSYLKEHGLVAPSESPAVPDTISKATVSAIIKYMTSPEIPDQTLSDEAWIDFLKASNRITDEADLKSVEWYQSQIDEVKANIQDTNNMRAVLREGRLNEDLSLWDKAKLSMVRPGLVLSQLVDPYFKWVSQPLAGIAWGIYFTGSEDYNRLFWKYHQENTKGENYFGQLVGTWQAYGQAWEHWDMELPVLDDTAAEWILKYVLMEGATDPLTYVGFGIYTRAARPFGVRGTRFMGAMEKGLAEVMEVPFDALKAPLTYKWSTKMVERLPIKVAAKTGIIKPVVGTYMIPRTPTQMAILAETKTSQYISTALSNIYNRQVRNLTMNEWNKGIEQAIKAMFLHPEDLDSPLVRAGREITKHEVFSVDEVQTLAARLESNLLPENINAQIVDSIDQAFETYFAKYGTGNFTDPENLATIVIDILGGSQAKKGLVVKSFERRAENILNSARSFGNSKDAVEAITSTMKRNGRIETKNILSEVAKARVEMGRSSAFMYNVERRIQRMWLNKFNDVVRWFAESYLIFAAYGPMNMVEDVLRSSLGGVRPGRTHIEKLNDHWIKVSIPTDFIHAKPITEMLGEAKGLTDGRLSRKWRYSSNPIAHIGEWLYGPFSAKKSGEVSLLLRANFWDKTAIRNLKELAPEHVASLAQCATAVVLDLPNPKLSQDIMQETVILVITGSPDVVRLSWKDWTLESIDKNEIAKIFQAHPEIPRPVQDYLMEGLTASQLQVRDGVIEGIDSLYKESYNKVLDDYILDSSGAYEPFELVAEEMTSREITTIVEFEDLLREYNLMSSIYDAAPTNIMGRAVERSRGLPQAEREVVMSKATDNVSMFRERAGGAMDNMLRKLETAAEANPDLAAAKLSLSDKFLLQGQKRVRISQMAEDINTWRREWFAKPRPKGKKAISTWWDDYAREVSYKWDELSRVAAGFDGRIIGPRKRQPIKIQGELSPRQLAQAMGTTPDDIRHGLLSAMSSVSSRDQFIEFILPQLVEGDIGFTREAIGNVYDQLVRELRIPGNKIDWLTKTASDLEGARVATINYFNSKMRPVEEIDRIKGYLNDVADRMERELYDIEDITKPIVISTKKLTEKVDAGEWYMTPVGDDSWYISTKPVEYEELVTKLPKSGDAWMAKRIGNEYNLTKLFYMGKKVKPKKTLKPKYSAIEVQAPHEIAPGIPYGRESKTMTYDEVRQTAADMATMQYHKEFTSYSDANAIDNMMKAIYPFWTYETQRWFWIPRSFARHPGTLTGYERVQGNTEYGNIHIPGTNVDINPFRGTVYGTLTTSLTRQDFPEYYDSLGAASGLIEFNDTLNRWGFYPGVHINVLQAGFLGQDTQYGELLPAMPKTVLDILEASLPGNESVSWISDHLFGDRFRDYLTMKSVVAMGGDATLIYSKLKTDTPLTEEERQIWDQAKRDSAWFRAMGEQTGMFRLKSDEQYELQRKATQIIEDMFGITKEQQEYCRRWNINLWDQIGNLSDSEQATLEALEFWKYSGLTRPLLPGTQQEILNRIEIGWNKVEQYTQTMNNEKNRLDIEFLTGRITAADYDSGMDALYSARHDYILSQMETLLLEPIPEDLTAEEKEEWIETHSLMSLDGRTAYFQKEGITQPTQHFMDELKSLFYSIKPKQKLDPDTGRLLTDWDTFWTLRDMVESAVPDSYKQEWEDFRSKNDTELEKVYQQINDIYFQKYNEIYGLILSQHTDEERQLIEEYKNLHALNQNQARQDELKMVAGADGKYLISSFDSTVSDAKKALRYANPMLEAWLYFWGRITTFVSPTGRETYNRLAKSMGKKE